MATIIDTLARHPEKAARPDRRRTPKPEWLRVRAPVSGAFAGTAGVVKRYGLKTVCEEASCPNIGECWQKRHATFLILGDTSTRACAFCNVRTGKPGPVDASEPQRVAAAVAELGLSHVVVTSVDRDDLEDGGAHHFAHTVRSIRALEPQTTIELLVPDFLRKEGALQIVLAARPDVLNHNLETVPRLYPAIRPGARYFHSLRLLQHAKEIDPSIVTKSGMMAGLGETREEILQVMDDMRSAEVDFLTLGQYLQPSIKHAAVEKYLEPDEFDALATIARAKGFALVAASPLTRSSYHAGEDFERLKRGRGANGRAIPAGI